jgi:hypothetical protein
VLLLVIIVYPINIPFIVNDLIANFYTTSEINIMGYNKLREFIEQSNYYYDKTCPLFFKQKLE